METDKEHDLKELLVNEKTKLMPGKDIKEEPETVPWTSYECQKIPFGGLEDQGTWWFTFAAMEYGQSSLGNRITPCGEIIPKQERSY